MHFPRSNAKILCRELIAKYKISRCMHYLINKEDSTARKHVVSRRHRRPRKLSMQDERKLLRHMKDLRHRQVTSGAVWPARRRIGQTASPGTAQKLSGQG